MGWKIIKGRPYFYTSERHGRRVRSHYWGGGVAAVLIAAERGLDRRDREEDRARRRALRAAILAEERRADEAFALVERAFRSAMGAMGYHRPGRGPWRKRRMVNHVPRVVAADERRETPGGITSEMRLADGGDAAALNRMTARFADGAKGSAFAGMIGSPGWYAEEAMLKVFAGDSRVGAAAGRRKLDDMRRELAGPDAPPLERMLADRVAYCWFRLYQLEADAARPDVELTISQSEFLQRRIDLAHRRHLTAVKALAVVHKLGLPSTSLSMSQTVTVSAKLQTAAGPEGLAAGTPPLAIDGGPDRA